MRRFSIGLLLVAMSTLMVELSLVRVFDVVWNANMAYMVITMVMFCFGLSGVYLSLRPARDNAVENGTLVRLAVAFAISNLIILPTLNLLPLEFQDFHIDTGRKSLLFMLMYLAISMPFFLAGVIITLLFSSYSQKIQTLYFWDLVGAAVGCLILIPFIPFVGPGGIVIIGGGLGLIAAALFSTTKKHIVACTIMGVVLMAIPMIRSIAFEGTIHKYFDFKPHIVKRGVKSDVEQGKLETTHWDPISKIDIINQQGRQWQRKHVAYDGGSQSSFIFPFDGDFEKLRDSLPEATGNNFGIQSVYLSHWLKQGTGAEVLVIGSAAGQEVKAALTFGASRVDAVELVGYVVRAGKELYNAYNGGIFIHPNVRAHVAEGRSFLRASKRQYDIIQIFSNHTSSSIAAGSGAMAPTYLQTADAYVEYFSHLKPDGMLHINHHVYPKMVATAAKAWKDMGLTDFRKHVLVFGSKNSQDNLPTLLVRMTPWTEAEVEQLRTWHTKIVNLLEDPFRPERSMLSDDFYSGSLPAEIIRQAPYRLVPPTDDRPYFRFLRKEWKRFSKPEPDRFLDFSTAALLSSQYVYKSPETNRYTEKLIPSDVVHLFITSAASLLFALVFVGLPLLFARAGRVQWPYKYHSLGYFSCLGAGFIIIELVYIQIFMKLIGFPLYTYSVVVFALLVAAGLGSYVSGKWRITPRSRWQLPFLGTLTTVALFLLLYRPVFHYFLTFPLPVRLLVATLLIVPPGFFMGMCFPLGILTIKDQPQGAIAWAWGMNGLFTVIGGILSVLFSIYFGFTATLGIGLGIYFLASLLYAQLRRLSIGSQFA